MSAAENLNPLAVTRTGQPPSPTTDPDAGWIGLSWTLLAALTPILLDMIFGSIVGGRDWWDVAPVHLGLSLFALTLAAFVRINSHRQGLGLLPVLILVTIVEVVLALFYGGTFHQGDAVSAKALRNDAVLLRTVMSVEVV